MTVLTSPGRPPTVEVTEVAATEVRREVAPTFLSIPPRDTRFVRISTPAAFGIAVLLYIVGASLVGFGAPWPLAAVPFTMALGVLVLSTLLALARTVLGLVSIVPAVRGGSGVEVAEALAKAVGNALLAAFGWFVAYMSTFGFSRGRQLRRRGRVLLPGLRANADWTAREMALDASEAPAGLADQWRENGKTEHASVAAFARLTLDLMALGAPPRLVAAANQDALDEIRHAELCFSLATAIDGRRTSPAPFPQAQRVATLPASRPLALARLAVSSLVDGALHEGVSARIIARLAKRAGSPAIRETLKSIAADEGRHSAHGWDVVEWCVVQGGTGVREALLGALRALPSRMTTNLPAGAADGSWESWGIHGHALEAEEYGQALALLGVRVRALAGRAAA